MPGGFIPVQNPNDGPDANDAKGNKYANDLNDAKGDKYANDNNDGKRPRGGKGDDDNNWNRPAISVPPRRRARQSESRLSKPRPASMMRWSPHRTPTPMSTTLAPAVARPAALSVPWSASCAVVAA